MIAGVTFEQLHATIQEIRDRQGRIDDKYYLHMTQEQLTQLVLQELERLRDLPHTELKR
jgi:hypothetical protein